MVTLSYHIRSSSKDAFEAKSRRLLLEAGSGNLTILLWDRVEKRPEAVEVFTGITNWDDHWDQMVVQSELLNLKNVETTVLFNTRRFLAMPSVFFERDAAREQLNAIFGQNSSLHFGGDVIPGEGMVMVWEVPQVIYSRIADHFSWVTYQCLGTAIQKIAGNGSEHESYGWVVVNGELAWIAAWKSLQLLMMKAVQISDPDDLAYQLVYACKQWQVENQQMHWTVAGIINTDAPLWKSPDRFFEHFEPASAGVNFDAEMPGHFFAHLIQFLQTLDNT